jgi:hypothetical protein
MQRSAFFILAGITMLAASPAVLADDTGLAYAHDLRKEGGRLCMSDHYHQGSGSGHTKPAAQAAAIRSWADFTNFEYGTVWARYGRAASRTVRYTKEADGWSADVDARPCK